MMDPKHLTVSPYPNLPLLRSLRHAGVEDALIEEVRQVTLELKEAKTVLAAILANSPANTITLPPLVIRNLPRTATITRTDHLDGSMTFHLELP